MSNSQPFFLGHIRLWQYAREVLGKWSICSKSFLHSQYQFCKDKIGCDFLWKTLIKGNALAEVMCQKYRRGNNFFQIEKNIVYLMWNGMKMLTLSSFVKREDLLNLNVLNNENYIWWTCFRNDIPMKICRCFPKNVCSLVFLEETFLSPFGMGTVPFI